MGKTGDQKAASEKRKEQNGGVHPGGRPTKWKDEFVEQGRKLAQAGWTDFEIANFFEVEEETLRTWKIKNEEFSGALKLGKDTPDDRVEASLFNRAVGYSYKSEKIFHHQGQITRAECTEHVPPDPGAAKHWLSNRRRDEWADDGLSVNVDLGGLLRERLKKVKAEDVSTK